MEIRDMVQDDAYDVTRLYLDIDYDVFVSVIGTYEALGKYIYDTCVVQGSLFGCDRVRVATVNDKVVGMSIIYDSEPLFVGPPKLLETLSDRFVDASVSQMVDVKSALDAGRVYLDALSVSPNYQRHGIGGALLDDALSRYDCVRLVCREDNKAALSLYASRDFRIRGMTFGISEPDKMIAMLLMDSHL